MGCCGQKRSQPPGAMPTALHAMRPVVQVMGGKAPGSGVQGSGVGGHGVMLRYRDRARVLVRGPVTGRSYEFSAGQPTQSVEARDAEALLRTRHFTHA